MNVFRTIIGLTLVFSAMAAGLTGNWAILALLLAVPFLLFGPWFINKYLWIRIPAMSTGLVYNRETKAFSRFLLPGRHWLRPFEQIKAIASVASGMTNGECSRAQTDGGVMVGIKWSFAYRLNSAAIADDLRPNVANMLLKSIEPLFHTHVNNCITYLFDQHTVATICEHGARQRLERELRDLVAERLAPFGVQTYRVILKSIELPRDVNAAVEASHKQELLAESEARALERLHQVVSQYTDADMERLLQLRQLQEMGQHGVSLHVPAYSVIGVQPQPVSGGQQAERLGGYNGHVYRPAPAD